MKENKPLVSVIIPSYNHEKYVGIAVKSAINQTYDNLEIIICDDGSKDNSRIVIESILDHRVVKYFNEKNIGATPNTNFLINKCKGKYIALMTSDDEWDKDKIRKQVEFLENNSEYGAVFTDVCMVNEEGRPLTKDENQWIDIFTQENRSQGKWLRKFFFEMNCLCHPSILVRKDVYDKTKLFNIAFRQLPDFKMWVDIIKFTKIYVIPEKLVTFRVLNNGKNTSADTEQNHIRTRNEINLIMKDFFEDIPKEILIDGFEEDLIYKKIENEKQLKIEQAFLYLKMESELNYLYSSIAIEKLYVLLQDKESEAILKEKYNFDFNDFFELTGQTNYKSLKKFDVYVSNEMTFNDKLVYFLKKIKKIRG